MNPRKHNKIVVLFVAMIAIVAVTACSTTRPVGEQADDAAITTKVKSKLAADPQVNATNVDVDTLDGVVTLRGEVEKESAKEEAEKLAADTQGVRSVRNQLQVVSEAEEDDSVVTDSWIATKINAKYTADPQLNPFNIDVDVQDGVVTLSGVVSDRSSRQEAEELARDTRGVKQVKNELEIETRLR